MRQADLIVILAYKVKHFQGKNISTARKSIYRIHTGDPSFCRLANVHSESIPNSIIKKIRELIFCITL